MSLTKTVKVTLTDGTEFSAQVTLLEDGYWEVYLPHVNSTGRGWTQQQAIVDALNEASASL